MRRIIVALCSVGLLIAVVAPAASATVPQRVTITSDMTLVSGVGNGGSYGTFEATGPAVTRHLICPTGLVRDVYLNAIEGGWDVVKAFVCDGGGQTFIIRLHTQDTGGTQSFSWTVKGGTGPYRGLFGTGSGTSTLVVGDQITDTYTGTLVAG